MKKVGDMVYEINLPALDGSRFSLDKVEGKRYLLTFFRFASCPFCNMRVHRLVSCFHQFGDNFTIVAIFDSSLANLQEHTERHKAPFHILADEENRYYRDFGIRHSWLGVLKGIIFRFPTLLKGMFKGYLPIKIRGKINTMPADLLVDESGMIIKAYYGKDEGDHLPFEELKSFALTGSTRADEEEEEEKL